MNKAHTKLVANAIMWIAGNDEPGELDEAEVASSVTVALVADLFKVESQKLAKLIVGIRKEKN